MTTNEGDILEEAIRDIRQALNAGEPTTFLSEDENVKLLNKINKSSPSDLIRLTRESDVTIMKLWKDGTKDKIGVPSDIFFAETIPLLDCEIYVDERDQFGGRGAEITS